MELRTAGLTLSIRGVPTGMQAEREETRNSATREKIPRRGADETGADTNRTYRASSSAPVIRSSVLVQVHKICHRKTANPIYVAHFRRVDLRGHVATP